MDAVFWTFLGIAGLCWIYLRRKRKFTLFERLGIPGPKPSLIYGNLMEIREKGGAEAFGGWIKKYGEICGFYNGALPFLIISDLELIKKIQIEDFANFTMRGKIITLSSAPEMDDQHIIGAPAKRWKEMRQVLNPSFKSSNLRQIFEIMDSCSDELMELLENFAKSGEVVAAHRVFQRVTTDAILKSAFGADTGAQKSKVTEAIDRLVDDTKDFIREIPLYGIFLLANCFPELDRVWRIILYLGTRMFVPRVMKLWGVLSSVVEKRRKDRKVNKSDVLQLLLNQERSEKDPTGMEQQGRRLLSADEVRSNAIVYMIAGFEATGISLQITLYLLARHHHIQDKLRVEVLRVIKEHGKITYDNLMEMEYLNKIFSESLRKYPINIGFITRLTANDYEHNGLCIPKGVSVLIPTSHMHHNPELFPTPDIFDPERFSTENKNNIIPMSYQPFGKGPRDCIGRPYATLEVKLVVAKVVSAYVLHLDREHHKSELNLDASFITSNPSGGIWLRVERI